MANARGRFDPALTRALNLSFSFPENWRAERSGFTSQMSFSSMGRFQPTCSHSQYPVFLARFSVVSRYRYILTAKSGAVHWKVSRLRNPALYSGHTVRSLGTGGFSFDRIVSVGYHFLCWCFTTSGLLVESAIVTPLSLVFLGDLRRTEICAWISILGSRYGRPTLAVVGHSRHRITGHEEWLINKSTKMTRRRKKSPRCPFRL